MLNTFVTHDRIVEFEPRIADYVGTGQSDYTTLVEKAKEVLTQGLKQNGLELKKLCIPLVLQASAAKTTSFTGTKSDGDSFERRIWYVQVTVAGSAEEIFTLQGTNDNSDETWADVETLTFIDTGEQNVLFDDVYTYYRINYAGTSATYSSNLYEESFHLAHIYKALEMIYVSHQKVIGSIWEIKASEYKDEFEKTLKNIKFTYGLNATNNANEGLRVYRPGFSR